MKKMPSVLAAAAVALSGWAESGSAVMLPPRIHTDDQPEIRRVTPTGKLIEAKLPGASASGAPAGMAAARLARPGRVFRWTPSPDTSRVTGGADLLDAALSPDESLLVLAERIGGAGALNSTRLLLVDLYGGRIVSSWEIERRRLIRIGFIPGENDELWAVAQGQEGGADQLLRISLNTGRIVAESGPLAFSVLDVAATESGLWTAAANHDFYQFDPANPATPPSPVRSQLATPKLLAAPDGSRLTVFGPGRLEIYRVIRNAKPVLASSRPLPSGFNPDHGLAVTPDASGAVLLETGGAARLIAGDSDLPLLAADAAPGCFHQAANLLLIGNRAVDGFCPFSLPATEPGKTVIPGKLRPDNRNGVFRIFARGAAEAEAVLIDHRANVYLLTFSRRRVKKQAVLIVDRTGFK